MHISLHSRDSVVPGRAPGRSNSMGREMSHRRSARVRCFQAAGVALTLGALLLASAATAGTGTAAYGTPRQPAAHAARVLNVRDEGHLRFIHASGSLLIDEGRVSGTFPGSVRVRFLYNGEPTVSAQFTISGSGGSINARGSGRLSSPTSPSPSFRGRMSITGGSGRYAHIHGSGELFGVFNRRSYALTVQAIAKLAY
jgi:hypothetical protein